MGSVMDTYQCKRCNGKVSSDYNYKTDESFSSCISCGSKKRHCMKRDDNRKVLFNEKNEPIWEDVVSDGYGTAHFSCENGVIAISAYTKPITEEDIKHFYERLENDEELIKKECKLVKFDVQSNCLIPIYGDLPEI